MTKQTLLTHLRKAGLVSGSEVMLHPLTGGVSSDIQLVQDGTHQFIVKRALPKLRVDADWHADVSRNDVEQDFLKYVGTFDPSSVPRVLYADRSLGFFVMEYLGEALSNWKTLLLRGHLELHHAARAGPLLGRIHARSWEVNDVRRRFQTYPNFHQLRVDPYLLTTAEKYPMIRAYLTAEASRLEHTSQCLVHGDFSPKNILVGSDRFVLLDCEVAWFGDPAFDVAFLLNHLFLKSIHLLSHHDAFLQLAQEAWQGYQSEMPQGVIPEIERRTANLLLMLMLARVDGKSPAEYLTSEEKKQTIRDFVRSELPEPPLDLTQLQEDWHRICQQRHGGGT